VARLVGRAVAGEVAPMKLSPDVLHSDRKPASKQIFAVATDRLVPPKRQRVRIPPLRRPGDDDRARG